MVVEKVFAPEDMLRESELFVRYQDKPILERDWRNYYEGCGAYQPAVIIKDGIFYLFYRAESVTRTGYVSRICLATSNDGIHFEKHPANPIISDDDVFEDKDRVGHGGTGAYDNLGRYYFPVRGVEDPRVVRIGDTYYMTYTEVDEEGCYLEMATSQDLINWKRGGNMLPDLQFYKAGAILPIPINGQYIMYFNRATKMWIAYSDDLEHWKVAEEPVMEPRSGHWDNFNTEPGSPPIIVDNKIVMIYNSETITTPDNHRGHTCSGFAVLDIENPARVIARSRLPLLVPKLFWERHGRIACENVIWGNSLLRVGDNFHLYYGAADAFCGLATSPVSSRFWEHVE